MAEKIYVIDDNVEVKEKYLKMSEEERERMIREIIEEDTAKGEHIRTAYAKQNVIAFSKCLM